MTLLPLPLPLIPNKESAVLLGRTGNGARNPPEGAAPPARAAAAPAPAAAACGDGRQVQSRHGLF